MKSIKIHLHDDSNLLGHFRSLYKIAQEVIKGQPLELILRAITKSRAQEQHYHSLIADIATVPLPYCDDDGNVIGEELYTPESWKAKLVWEFEQEMFKAGTPLRHGGSTTLSIDGLHVIQLRPSTTKFVVKEGSEFIEYLYSFGAELDVKWTDSRYEDYRGA